jgi:hypothetical protein
MTVIQTHVFCFYHRETGVLHGKMVSTDGAFGAEDFARANAPAGHLPIRGRFDPRMQRVNVELLKPADVATAAHVIDYQPPQPSADHEWNSATKRWQLSAAAKAKAEGTAAARARHEDLIRQQHDDVRRAVLGDAAARERLQAIESEIAALQRLTAT